MLNLMEKMDLQDAIAEGLDKLDAGIDDLMERMDVQDSIAEALDKLFGESTAPDNSLLRRLLAGEFNNKPPLVFIRIVEKVYAEIQDVKPLHEPVCAYAAANKTGIFESALRNAGLFIMCRIFAPFWKEYLNRPKRRQNQSLRRLWMNHKLQLKKI